MQPGNSQILLVYFVYKGYNLLLDPLLREHMKPADQFCHDWMHCLFQSGVWNITLFLVLRAIYKSGAKDLYATLYTYLQSWHGPKKFKIGKIYELFTKARQTSNNEAKKFKCDDNKY